MMVAPAFTGTLSLLGSVTIIYMIVRQRKYLDSRFRLLLGLFISDFVIAGFTIFLPLPIPAGTPGVMFAMGNDLTCNLQGAMFQIGCAAAALYTTALSHYFMCSIRNGLSDKEYAQQYEYKWHALSIGFPLATAMTVLALDSYAYVSFGCWIGPYPFGCHDSDEIECIRGDNAFLYAWLFMGLPLILMICYILYCMLQIYKTVHEISESRMAAQASTASFDLSVQTNPSSHALYNAKKETAIQAYLYVGCFVGTRQFAFVVYILDQAGVRQPVWLPVIDMTLWSLQGFFNVFIFIRPRIRALRRRFPEMGRLEATYNAIARFDELMPQQRSHRRRSNAALVRRLRRRTSRSREASLVSIGGDTNSSNHATMMEDLRTGHESGGPIASLTAMDSCHSSNDPKLASMSEDAIEIGSKVNSDEESRKCPKTEDH